jgi:serine/threonine protein kinase
LHGPSSIGAYEVVATLARGPDRFLYLGKARTSDMQVVIKVWRTARALSAPERERIQQEFETLAQLKHQHILPLLEVQTTEQEIAIVRAYAPGGSLHTRLVRHFHKPLALDETLGIIGQVGQAMHAAHQQHIMHGNLTPQNVLFTEQGQAVLSDFRFGSILAAIGAYAGESPFLRWYMAPEQFEGTHNAATDQYALGCLAYELLTGSVPFSGWARTTLLQKHKSEQPVPPSQINPAIPPWIEQAILKALAKQPAERHHDMQVFLNALETPSLPPTLVSPVPIEAEDIQLIPPSSPGPYQGSAQHVSSQKQGRGASDVSGTHSESVDAHQEQQSPGRQSKGSMRMLLPIMLAVLVIMLLSTLLVLPLALLRGHGGTPVTASPTTDVVTWFTPTTALSPIVILRSSPTPGLLPPSTQGFSTSPQPIGQPSATATTGPQQGSVRPLFECIVKQGAKGFLAKFGYVNDNPSAVTIPVGSENSLSPSWLNGAQPTTFSPGYQPSVVQVSVNRGSIVWSLDGTTATATGQGPTCTT